MKPTDPDPDSFKLLGKLLATIHSDGGHYVAKHGWDKATIDAASLVLETRLQLYELKSNPPHLKK